MLQYIEVYRPYVLDTVIAFETESPTVEEMAARIVAARLMREWLVLEVDGDVAGYAYAHQLNPRAAYQWWVEASVYMAQDRLRLGGGRMPYSELLSRLARDAASGERSPASPNPTSPATRRTGPSGSGRWSVSAGRMEARRVARRPVVAARLGCPRR